ncbi:MAG: hypothetical protein ACTSX8_01655, partial [Alphaproteobacteria bacterium]
PKGETMTEQERGNQIPQANYEDGKPQSIGANIVRGPNRQEIAAAEAKRIEGEAKHEKARKLIDVQIADALGQIRVKSIDSRDLDAFEALGWEKPTRKAKPKAAAGL